MDARLYDDVRNFVDCIKDTPEYREFTEQKKIIEGYPELKEKAESLRERNLELQSRLDEQGDNLEQVMKFADENEEIFMEPVINGYLTAESAFCRIVKEALDMTMEALEI